MNHIADSLLFTGNTIIYKTKGVGWIMSEPKTALITGSYGGLGAAFAAEHAKRGCKLIISDLNPDRLEEQKTELETRYGTPVHAIPADLTKSEETERLFSECREKN